ncbi:hypothetical protein [Gorillibacterium timonense]|uniref:hypothetical protein n=1 Tax=Gorillibacterium timonense TaxID=1689269 RepID=UPI00071C550D|nr:hypothetical protein [Gorillibacterium timonense]
MLPLLESEAKERRGRTLKKGAAAPDTEKIPEREQSESRAQAAKLAGTNERYVSDDDSSEGCEHMSISLILQVAEIKCRLLELAATITEDETFPREAIVLDLLQAASNAQALEAELAPQLDQTITTLFKKLDTEGRALHE